MSIHSLVQNSIQLALDSHWEDAITTNEEILKEIPDDIDTHNRLAFAFTQIGEIDKAKKLYKKILSIDQYNFIAQKNYDKLSALGSKAKSAMGNERRAPVHPYLFLEEPGKTKAVHLKNPAPIAVLSKLRIGDKVLMNPKKHSIDIRDNEKNHLGVLPDDISYRLLLFLKLGSTYEIYVKNVQKNGITVFIKEIFRGKKTHNQPTFQTSTTDYTTSAPRELKTALDPKAEADDDQSSSDEE